MDPLEQAARALHSARSVVAFTGAGISVGSGLRPYRGKGGLWDSGEVDPMEVASQPALERDPERVIAYLDDLVEIASAAKPNPAHETLVAMERALDEFAIVTQNVDGLHARAGSQRLFEVHGSIARQRSFRGHRMPDVVLFGGMLPMDVFEGAQRHILRKRPSVALVVGTTAAFPYIQSWIAMARRQGATVIEINIEPTVITPALTHVLLEGQAEILLPRLWERANALEAPALDAVACDAAPKDSAR